MCVVCVLCVCMLCVCVRLCVCVCVCVCVCMWVGGWVGEYRIFLYLGEGGGDGVNFSMMRSFSYRKF